LKKQSKQQSISTMNKRLQLKEFTSNDIQLQIVQKEIGEDFPLHSHNYFELEYITKGEADMLLNGKHYLLKAGDFFLLSPNDFHSISPTDKYSIINLSFDGSLLPEYIFVALLNKVENIVVHSLDDSDKIVRCFLEKLLYEYENSFFDRENAIKNLLHYVMIYIYRKFFSDKNHASQKQNELSLIINYLSLHFKENISLTDVANTFHFNPNYFSQRFKKYLGMSFVDYVNSLKVNYAKQLLLFSDTNVVDVGFLCGFNSLSNFLRVFKKEVGMPPTEFRKEHKK